MWDSWREPLWCRSDELLARKMYFRKLSLFLLVNNLNGNNICLIKLDAMKMVLAPLKTIDILPQGSWWISQYPSLKAKVVGYRVWCMISQCMFEGLCGVWLGMSKGKRHNTEKDRRRVENSKVRWRENTLCKDTEKPRG